MTADPKLQRRRAAICSLICLAIGGALQAVPDEPAVLSVFTMVFQLFVLLAGIIFGLRAIPLAPQSTKEAQQNDVEPKQDHGDNDV